MGLSFAGLQFLPAGPVHEFTQVHVTIIKCKLVSIPGLERRRLRQTPRAARQLAPRRKIDDQWLLWPFFQRMEHLLYFGFPSFQIACESACSKYFTKSHWPGCSPSLIRLLPEAVPSVPAL